MLESTIIRAYAVTYRQHHNGKIDKYLPVEFDDLAGTKLYGDTLLPDGS